MPQKKVENKIVTISNYNKHTKLSERIKIENGLNNVNSFRTISKDINKSVATISREIQSRKVFQKGNYFYNFNMKCKKMKKCLLFEPDALIKINAEKISM